MLGIVEEACKEHWPADVKSELRFNLPCEDKGEKSVLKWGFVVGLTLDAPFSNLAKGRSELAHAKIKTTTKAQK